MAKKKYHKYDFERNAFGIWKDVVSDKVKFGKFEATTVTPTCVWYKCVIENAEFFYQFTASESLVDLRGYVVYNTHKKRAVYPDEGVYMYGMYDKELVKKIVEEANKGVA